MAMQSSFTSSQIHQHITYPRILITSVIFCHYDFIMWLKNPSHELTELHLQKKKKSSFLPSPHYFLEDYSRTLVHRRKKKKKKHSPCYL